MKVTSLFSVFCVFAVGVLGQPGPRGGLNPEEIVEVIRHGGVLTYDIDVKSCIANLPSTLPTYSFGEVLNDISVEYAGPGQWHLYSTVERPVNGSRFNLQSNVWRVTELDFEPDSPQDGTATITITDIEPVTEKPLANGTLTCKISTGGFKMDAQRRGGAEVERIGEAMDGFLRGELLTFSVDISACTKKTPYEEFIHPHKVQLGANEFWLSRIADFRIPDNAPDAVEFTSILDGSGQREVFNVRVQGDNTVEIKMYALTRSGSQPTPVVVFACTLGLQGSFHMYRL